MLWNGMDSRPVGWYMMARCRKNCCYMQCVFCVDLTKFLFMKYLSSGNYLQLVLWCRAAAYGKMGEHQKSIDDCKKALELDPKYSKAYGRMGWVTVVVQDTILNMVSSVTSWEAEVLFLPSLQCSDIYYYYYNRFTPLCPGLSRWVSTRRINHSGFCWSRHDGVVVASAEPYASYLHFAPGDNHASTSSVRFLRAGCPSWHPTNSVRALKAIQCSDMLVPNPTWCFCVTW